MHFERIPEQPIAQPLPDDLGIAMQNTVGAVFLCLLDKVFNSNCL